ncbi:dirigent protein 17 [Fagus crenata]
MENSSIEQEPESSSTGIFKLSGEPAIVINGIPNVSASDSTPVLNNTVNDAEINRNTGFGDWSEGRGVQKLFGKQYFSGMVT